MLNAALDPAFSSLDRRKLPASRSRFDTQRLSMVTKSRENSMLALRTSSAKNHHAYFPTEQPAPQAGIAGLTCGSAGAVLPLKAGFVVNVIVPSSQSSPPAEVLALLSVN